MPKIPKPQFTTKIEEAIETKVITSNTRPYMGISMIGSECPRAMFYTFRWTTPKVFTPRVRRLLDRGHREEPIIIKDLEEAGCIVEGTQEEVVFAHGHGKGHCDGIVKNLPDAPKTPHLLEMKTANDKNFAKIKKEGILSTKPEYWAQGQCYCKLLKLKRGLFIVVNKNDDSRYYERFNYSAHDAKFYIDRATDIVITNKPPAKIGGSDWWQCKWCDHYDVCHFNKSPMSTCRTCRFIGIYPNGQWRCEQKEVMLSTNEQRKGCNMYEILETLK